MASLGSAQGHRCVGAREASPGGHLNEVDALLAPRWSGYGGAPAVFNGVFVRQLLTRCGTRLDKEPEAGRILRRLQSSIDAQPENLIKAA